MARQQGTEIRDGVELKHLDDELFDDAGASKRDLVHYVDALAEPLLRELRDRPLTVLRVRPGQAPFMQKNLPAYAPGWIPTVSVWSQASQRDVRYPLCHDRRTLLWLAGQRAVELHPTVADIEGHVTRLVLDLDPPDDAPWPMVVAAAEAARAVLDEVGLAGAVKTSGSTGLHIAVPVAEVDAETAALATRALAARVARLDPANATDEFLREDRHGRVFVDPTRVGGGSLACAFSPRARPGVPVSFPLDWDSLAQVRPADFTITTAAGLLGGRDPWAEALRAAPRLPGRLVDEGRSMPVPRVAGMHEGRRRRRAAGAAD